MNLDLLKRYKDTTVGIVDNITLYENILQNKIPRYLKYKNNTTFINDIKNRLRIEKELLNDFIKDLNNESFKK